MTEPGQLDPMQVMADLNAYSDELDQLSRKLEGVEERYALAKDAYDDFMAGYEIGLWTQSQEDGTKMPREKLTERLGHKAMPPIVLGEYTRMSAERDRLMRRERTLKSVIDGKRSVLSALKEEMQAVGR